MLSTVGRCRKEYYFGPENDFTITVEDDKDATRLLSSSIHKFIVVPDKVEAKPEPKPEVKPVSEPKIEPEIKPKVKKKGKVTHG